MQKRNGETSSAIFYSQVAKFSQAVRRYEVGGGNGGGETGAIAPGPPFKRVPVIIFICVKQNIRLKNCRDSKEIQEYNSIFDVALSIIDDFSASLTFCQF